MRADRRGTVPPSPAGRLISGSERDGEELTGEVPTSAAELLDTLQRYQLLSPEQIDEIIRDQHSEACELVRDLLERGWLTTYQRDQLLLGRGKDLRMGRYLLLEFLGQGGTGQVLKVLDQTEKRVVALKTIRPDLLAEPEIVQRFYREMEVMSSLAHPNIVRAHDAGPIGPVQVLVMEYVEGGDLGRLVRSAGPLPVAEALEYCRQAAVGLQYAHEQGLVHRDIKPANLLLTARFIPERSEPALVKILDLGLARFQRTTADDLTNVITPPGAGLIGTPDYLAPEQAIDFHQADIRADIYSLGCTLYFLLAGRPPFPGGTLGEKLAKQIHAQPVPLEELRSDLPPAAKTTAVFKSLTKWTCWEMGRFTHGRRGWQRCPAVSYYFAASARILTGRLLPSHTSSGTRRHPKKPPKLSLFFDTWPSLL